MTGHDRRLSPTSLGPGHPASRASPNSPSREPCMQTRVRARQSTRAMLRSLNSSLQEANRKPDAANRALLESNAALKAEVEQRGRAEQALLDADRRKDDFLAILAHELRNPLAPISNAIEILQRLGSKDPELVRMRELIDRQVRHMTRLVD